MNDRYAVLVGLSFFDAAVYKWDGRAGCQGCEADVDFMRELLITEGVLADRITTLKSEEATAHAVLSALKSAVGRAGAGDLVIFCYAGHGGQSADLNGDEEKDGKDETLCLFDREVLDDEVGAIWGLLPRDAYGLMLSDSCNSGSIAKAIGGGQRPLRPFLIAERRGAGKRDAGHGGLIQIGAARDGESAQGYYDGGAFTMALRRVAEAGLPRGYSTLCEQIAARLRADGESQQVQYVEWGLVTRAFSGSRPFALPVELPGDRGIDDPEELPDIFEDDNTNPDDDLAESAPRSPRSVWRLADRVAEGQAKLRKREKQLGKKLSDGVRDAMKVTGVVLHQTGFARTNELARYDGITAHFVIAPDGQTSQLHPIDRVLYSANEFNRYTVSIEIVGNFPSVRGRWWSKQAPNHLSRRQVESGKALMAHLRAKYPQLTHVYGHIQSKGVNRGNDPGPDIWCTIAQHAVADLGYIEDPTVHQKYDGLPIPDAWRTRAPDLID